MRHATAALSVPSHHIASHPCRSGRLLYSRTEKNIKLLIIPYSVASQFLPTSDLEPVGKTTSERAGDIGQKTKQSTNQPWENAAPSHPPAPQSRNRNTKQQQARIPDQPESRNHRRRGRRNTSKSCAQRPLSRLRRARRCYWSARATSRLRGVWSRCMDVVM